MDCFTLSRMQIHRKTDQNNLPAVTYIYNHTHTTLYARTKIRTIPPRTVRRKKQRLHKRNGAFDSRRKRLRKLRCPFATAKQAYAMHRKGFAV